MADEVEIQFTDDFIGLIFSKKARKRRCPKAPPRLGIITRPDSPTPFEGELWAQNPLDLAAYLRANPDYESDDRSVVSNWERPPDGWIFLGKTKHSKPVAGPTGISMWSPFRFSIPKPSGEFMEACRKAHSAMVEEG